MPKSCVVPGCRSNYYGGEYTPVFSFPANQERRQLWINKIPRENLVVTKNSGVCIKHFHEEKILREIRATRPDGSELVAPRKKLELANDAVPAIFPNLPTYLSTDAAPARKAPDVRRQENIRQQNEKYDKWLSEDRIFSLDDVIKNTHKFNHSKWVLKTHDTSTKVYFMKIDFHESPAIRAVLMIDERLNVNVICDNFNVETKHFEYILGSKLICDTYSKLENLLTSVYNFEAECVPVKDKIKYIQTLLLKVVEQSEENEAKTGFQFLSDQLGLLVSKQLRYSADLLLIAANFYFSFPAAYKCLRDLKMIVLPHPSYLKTFNLSSIDGGINSPLKVYLETKCQALKPHERTVSLLLDEIYVKPKITYKGNKVVGMATNSAEIQSATTVQTFMIKSVLSNNKDVVALLPVKNLDSGFLYNSTLQVLQLLNEVGYEVVCIISDANKVNVKCYKQLSNDSSVSSCIVHPFDSEKKIFLLFDTVHILKNLRNNWLNEKTTTFIYPSFQNVTEIKQCKFQHIREVYQKEKQSVVKHAPGLSFKVCFPNNIERQNVSLVVPLFEDKTITTLDVLLGIEADGTREWLEIMRKWWLVVNVKHPDKGTRLREKYAEPIRRIDQENVKYLQEFCDWLKKWEDILVVNSPRSCGKLSRETYTALLHTTETLIKLCEYLLTDKEFHYVMLGVFQTDDLELRFGRYRIMSGCNYNVSVQQIIESERKLKVTSLLKLKIGNSVSLNVTQIITDINECCDDILTTEDVLELSETIVTSCSEIDIDNSTLEVLIFIAGYVSFKVSCVAKCAMCKDLLITDRELDFEAPPTLNYLNHLNRGGLKYPSPISVDIGICVYKIFQFLFLKDNQVRASYFNNPKTLIKSLLLKFLEPLYDAEVCECGKPLIEIANGCMNVWVNILLNNYSKMKNNDCLEANQAHKKRCSKDNSNTNVKKSRKLNVFHAQ